MNADAAIANRPDTDLRTFAGRDIRVSVFAETLFDAERGVRSGRLVRSRVLDAATGAVLPADERAGLLASDCERIDASAMSRARPLLVDCGGAAILEVSLVTVSSQRARPGVAQAAAALRDLCGGALIWLLTDLPECAPSARLGEAITFLKSHGRSVFAAVNSPSGFRSLRGAPISGLVLSAPLLPLDNTDAALWLLNAGRALDQSGPAARIAAGLASPVELAGLAAAAGFTHVAGGSPARQALAARGGFC